MPTGMDFQFWIGLLIGFVLGIAGNLIVNYCWELRTRCLAYADAKPLVGTWEAYNIRGRTLEPMEGAGNTVITAKPRWWNANSNILQVSGVDTSDGRHHHGTLVIDPRCTRRATRILIYESPTPDEVMEQRVVISHDRKTLYMFPVLATIGLASYTSGHALRKVADTVEAT